jgi:hypothetical protein
MERRRAGLRTCAPSSKGTRRRKRTAGRYLEPVSAYVSTAKSALDRIVIPQEVLDRIASTASLRSSLIISDEALSAESAKGTEFVAVLSNEIRDRLSAQSVSCDQALEVPWGLNSLPFSTTNTTPRAASAQKKKPMANGSSVPS